ncbi:MAG: hypothetical protein LH472_02355 [Pyrinomonadaceae bacterium]|nr:hypothetical protein [Pyrinomonadaceae bacterium]
MSFSTEIQPELARLRDEIKRGTRIVSLSGLTSIAAKAYVLSQIQTETKKTFVIVADTNKELETWECDLDFWSGEWRVESREEKSSVSTLDSRLSTLPSFETDIYSGVSPHAETQEERALTLWRLAQNAPDFLIVSAKSLITKTVAPVEMKNLGAHLKRDEDFAPEKLIEKLIASGYVREEPLKSVGEFSVRGGIIDVWSPTQENPVRLEFFGDTIDSIREFNAETQLSIRQLSEISVAPMREFSATAKDFKDWAFFARERFDDERFARNLKDRTQFADEGEDFSGWEFFISLVNPRSASVFDYLKDAIFIVDEPLLVEQTLSNYYETIEKHFAEITEADDIGLAPNELFLSGAELREKLADKQRIELRALGRTAAQTDEQFQVV